jgi:hypothetical protein
MVRGFGKRGNEDEEGAIRIPVGTEREGHAPLTGQRRSRGAVDGVRRIQAAAATSSR